MIEPTAVKRQFRLVVEVTEPPVVRLDPALARCHEQIKALQARALELRVNCMHTWRVKGPFKLNGLVTTYAPAGEPYALVRGDACLYYCTHCGAERRISTAELCPACCQPVTIGEHKLGNFDAFQQYGADTYAIFVTGVSGNTVVMATCVPCKLTFLVRDEYEH